MLAIAANSLGTLAAVTVALMGLRRRPLGNALILAGLLVAALGSALAGLGEAESALFSTAAALLLYGGFVLPSRASEPRRTLSPGPPAPLPEPEERERARDEKPDRRLGDEPRRAAVREDGHRRESSHRPPTV